MEHELEFRFYKTTACLCFAADRIH